MFCCVSVWLDVLVIVVVATVVGVYCYYYYLSEKWKKVCKVAQ